VQYSSQYNPPQLATIIDTVSPKPLIGLEWGSQCRFIGMGCWFWVETNGVLVEAVHRYTQHRLIHYHRDHTLRQHIVILCSISYICRNRSIIRSNVFLCFDPFKKVFTEFSQTSVLHDKMQHCFSYDVFFPPPTPATIL
jgi:hypothetical protein